MDEQRFDRLEQKIDKLTDAVTKIVRVEEQLISNNKRLDRVEKRIDKNEEDIDNVYKLVRETSGVAKFSEKLFWIVVTVVVSAGLWWAK